MRYDTQDLISQVKRIESIPTNQSTFEDSDFVRLLDGELTNTIVPLIQRTNEEYFVVYKDIEVTPQINSVTIPPEATGLRLRSVLWVNQDGSFSQLARLSVDAVSGYNFAFGGYYGLSGYYLQNNKVLLYPTNTANGTLRLMFFRRPASLCEVSESGRILSVDTLNNTITCDNVPSSWGAGTVIDALESTVPFIYRKEQMTIINKSGFDIELSPSDIASLSVGDIIALEGEAPVCQYVPTEAYQMLCQTTAMRCLESLGDRPGWANAKAKYDTMERDFLMMINPRVSGEPKKLIGAGGILGATRINTYTSYW